MVRYACSKGFSLCSKPALVASLRLSGNFQFHFAIKCWHFQLATKGSIDKANGYLAMQMPAFALENCMRLNMHLNI